MCRYQIQYTVSDANNRAAAPLSISITFVEVAVVTGSLLFISQAPNATTAQQQAAQLFNPATPPNFALTTAVAAVFRTWLTSTTSAYVRQLTSTLGTSAATVAATNTLQLGLFSAVKTPDVTVLDAAIDQTTTLALNANSSSGSLQSYAYNVTLQVVVLTADMLLSVFVDVLNATYTRRRLLSSPDLLCSMQPAEDCLSALSAPASTSKSSQQHMHSLFDQRLEASAAQQLGLVRQRSVRNVVETPATLQQLREGVLAPPNISLQQYLLSLGSNHSRGLLASGGSTNSSASSSSFPLASLLMFKMQLVLAAFTGTSGCDRGTLVDLFYQNADPPDILARVCRDREAGVDVSLDEALRAAAANSSVPLMQVRL